MNQSGIIQAEQIFYPGWLMVSQLRSGQEVQDGKALYRKARQLVTLAREKLVEAGFSQANIDTMLYAFCALLDESVLNRGKADDGWRTWQQDPLQAHFFGRLDAGEELWERIREQLKAPVPLSFSLKENASGGKRTTVRVCPADSAVPGVPPVHQFLPFRPAA